jgi:T5orf172 domain
VAYGDLWEREVLARLQEWEEMRWRREDAERQMHPNDRLDEIGWDIFYCAMRGMTDLEAARLALDGNLRQRLRVRDDLLKRHRLDLERRYTELNPSGAGFGVFNTTAPQQRNFWTSRLENPTFIYFIQSGEDGPIKIGFSNRPDRRLPELQTGNPRELILRHVIPGDTSVERQLHTRFEPARDAFELVGYPVRRRIRC